MFGVKTKQTMQTVEEQIDSLLSTMPTHNVVMVQTSQMNPKSIDEAEIILSQGRIMNVNRMSIVDVLNIFLNRGYTLMNVQTVNLAREYFLVK